MKYQKGNAIVGLAIVAGLILVGISLIGSGNKVEAAKDNPFEKELNAVSANQTRMIAAIPIPELQNSSERANVSKRAQIFNNENKISYIYLVSYGKVMAFYTVKGKVSSLRSYMAPMEQLVDWRGRKCDSSWSNNCGGQSSFVVSAPDIDGTYGENVEGIFFFTTEGAYVEWKGEYMMSDQPLKLTTQPELIRQIQ